jgi:uncharacterized membrane protein
MEFGPVQMLVLEFDRDRLKGEILPELDRLRQNDIIRLVDLVVVEKSDDGEVMALETSDLTAGETTAYGAVVGGLIGFGAAGEEGAVLGAAAGAEAAHDGGLGDNAEVWYVADAIPPGSIAAIALIEHRWAIPLRDAVGRAGGVALADEWIHPEDLVALGAVAATGG